jgi:hypothetical protein
LLHVDQRKPIQNKVYTGQKSGRLPTCCEDVASVDVLDALACLGLKLMPDSEGNSSNGYTSSHKSAIRSAKAEFD